MGQSKTAGEQVQQSVLENQPQVCSVGRREKYAHSLFDISWCIAFDSSLQTTKER